MNIKQAIEIADAYIIRQFRRKALIETLRASNMGGLECGETVELEQLNSQDVAAGWALAKAVKLFLETESRSEAEQVALLEKFALLDMV